MPVTSTANPPNKLPAWPCPRWVAHRGAGRLAPENTLAAFRLGASWGARMFECDAKLSADGELFLLHDDTLDRCTNASGDAAALPWSALSRLDAGSWHSPTFAGEPLPRLAAVLQFCAANALGLNIELKPNPGQAQATGKAVAQLLQALWPSPSPLRLSSEARSAPLPKALDTSPPFQRKTQAHGLAHGQGAPTPCALPAPPILLSSFEPESLRAAQQVDARWPRALLLEHWRDSAIAQCTALGGIGLIADHALWLAQRVAAAHAAGLRCAAYTVNDTTEAQRLWQLGLDTLITDAVMGCCEPDSDVLL